MRIATIIALLIASPASAGFVTIDEFTNAANSDGIGERTTEGLVAFGQHGFELGIASAISGVPIIGPSSIQYRFTPQPLVAAPIFLVLARNNQTSIGETGVMRGIAGGQAIDYLLPGGQQLFVPYSFDFTATLGGTAAIDSFRIEWLLPEGGTGARQLVLDSISVHEAPEPSTLGLIGVAAIGAWWRRLTYLGKGQRRIT